MRETKPASHNNPPQKRRKKKKQRIRIGRLMMLMVPFVLLIGLAGYAGYRVFNPLLLKSSDYVVEYKEGNFSGLDNVKSLWYGSKDDIAVEGKVDSSKTGDYPVTYTYKGRTYPFTVTVADTKAPELKLKDVATDTATVVKAEDFVDEVKDTSDYTLKISGGEDQKAGRTSVKISAVDSFGNETTKNATLTRKQDKTAPVLADFKDTKTMLQGDEFRADRFELTDDLDPNPALVTDTNAVNTDVPGDYPVTYTVTDRSGNQQQYTQTVTVESNPDYGKKIAYLTFDDGPSENTLAVLDALDKYDAKATFFVTGVNPEYYHLMKDIVDRGHTIALHTFSHQYDEVYASEDAYFEDLQKISDLVEEETGIVADCLRFPGGSSNMVSSDYSKGIMSKLVNDVQEKGYQYFDWNADSTDASGFGIPPATLTANATAPIEAGEEKVNILFHDANGKETTAEALPDILKAYSDAGYVFRGVTNTGFAPHHDVNN